MEGKKNPEYFLYAANLIHKINFFNKIIPTSI